MTAKSKRKDVGIVSADLLNKIKSDHTSKNPNSDSIVIRPEDLSQMKAASRIMTRAEKLQRQKTKNHRKEHIREVALRRKEEMTRMDAKKKAASGAIISEIEKQEAEDRAHVVSEAQRLMDESMDVVKKMNSMVMYAKVQTTRDRQLEDKKIKKAAADAEDKRLDDIMENERLKKIRAEIAKNDKSALERKRGADMIKKQMHVKEKERELEKELLYQEGQDMKNRNKAMEDEEQLAKEQRQKESLVLLAEIQKSNDAAAHAKAEQKEHERLEDEAIAQYLRNKDARETQLEHEKMAAVAEKERHVKLMISKQSRTLDRRSELDELRAKRAQEEVDRRWRAEQLSKAKHQAAMRKELEDARVVALNEKERLLAIQMQAERDEFDDGVRVIRKAETERRAKETQLRVEKEQYKKALLDQIEEKERLAGRATSDDMGKKQWKVDKGKLERIKKEKLEELERAGVPRKYLGELQRFQVE